MKQTPSTEIKRFQDFASITERQRQYTNIMHEKRAKNRVPVICLPRANTKYDQTDGDKPKHLKFLCPRNMTIGELHYSIRRKINSTATEPNSKVSNSDAIYLMLGSVSVIPLMSDTIETLYNEHKDQDDSFLYLVYCPESTFG